MCDSDYKKDRDWVLHLNDGHMSLVYFTITLWNTIISFWSYQEF
jgi:hypothetical protein